MGSAVITTSTAVDNRLAVTDQGFGLSSSGTGNNTALQGDIFNINAAGYGAGRGSGGTGGGINLNILDGGAINKAFDFAAFSLSETLGKLIQSEKNQTDTAKYTAETLSTAIQQSSQISAAAQAANQAAAAELEKENKKFLLENGKKILIYGGLAFAGYWWFLRGKK